jgi:hypothetical protein
MFLGAYNLSVGFIKGYLGLSTFINEKNWPYFEKKLGVEICCLILFKIVTRARWEMK